jgi:two-component system NarL family sensor kinase
MTCRIVRLTTEDDRVSRSGVVIWTLDQNAETALFRVVQEALINVHRHGGSSRAWIRLRRRRTHDGLTLEVENRGRGLSTTVLEHLPIGRGALGVGVAGVRERLQDLGGTLEIASSENGTTVRAHVPLVGQPR